MVEDTFLEPITKSGKRINYLSASEQAKRRDQFMALPGVSDKVNAMAESLGVTPDEILYVIKKETAGSYSSKQKNLGGGSATGLIQFLGTGGDKGKGGKTVGGTFYSYSDLENMSTLEQLDVVESYFNKNFKAKGGKPGELYVAVAAPAYVGKADGSTVVYKAGSQNAKDNKGWQNEDGNVTLDSLKSFGATEGFVTYTPQVKSSSSAVNSGDKGKTGSDIKNEDNLRYLRRRAQQGPVELSDADVELVANLAEDQRIQWSKLGVPSISDVLLNATGIQQNKIGVDDDATNEIHRATVVEGLSEGLDVNTIEGKKILRQRLASYADLVKSDEWKEKVEALAGDDVRETSYQNMIEDLSFDYRTLIVDANKIHKLEGDEKIDYEDSVRLPDEEGVMSDNKSIIKSEIEEGNTELSERVAKEGLDAVALDLAKAQKDAAESGDLSADAPTLLAMADKEREIAIGKESLEKGVERGEALALSDDDTEEEEEDITTTFDLWKKDNPDGTLEQWQDSLNDDTEGESNRLKKMQNAELALGGLKAAAGVLSLSKALRDPEVDVPEISPLVYEALNKQKQLANSGLTAAEKNAAMQNLNNAYAGAMKNVLRASGGQRGLFLANQGTVDANRIAGLNQLAAQDAALHRENIKQYNALATSVGQMTLNRDMTVEQMKQTTMNQNRKVLGSIGTNLLSDALSDAGAYLDPNRELYQKITRNTLENMADMQSQGYTNPYLNQTVGTADTDPNEESEETEKPE